MEEQGEEGTQGARAGGDLLQLIGIPEQLPLPTCHRRGRERGGRERGAVLGGSEVPAPREAGEQRAEERGGRVIKYSLCSWQPSQRPLASLLRARSGGRGDSGAAHPACCGRRLLPGTCCPEGCPAGEPGRRLYRPRTERYQPAVSSQAASQRGAPGSE